MVGREELLLSAQSALLGHVTQELRAASVYINEINENLVVIFYCDGIVSDELEDSAYVVTAETEGHFPWLENGEIRMTDTQIVRVDFPQPLPLVHYLVYLRFEPGCQIYRNFVPKEVFTQVDSVSLRLAGLRALIGRCTPNLRRVYIYEEANVFFLHFYYHGIISELEKKLTQEALTHIVTSFHTNDQCKTSPFELRVDSLDFPQRISRAGHCLYARSEPSPHSNT